MTKGRGAITRNTDYWESKKASSAKKKRREKRRRKEEKVRRWGCCGPVGKMAGGGQDGAMADGADR